MRREKRNTNVEERDVQPSHRFTFWGRFIGFIKGETDFMEPGEHGELHLSAAVVF